ncbi:class F sortase [Diaminobutyricimonas sp. LJ205]|uniref:class F sortase n=1 Tax=Diaminobutyricimonas sp. LJ205 TaxID=2683590 RepID=UPI0012F4FC03|nr:class F sortase [Diaminobutyricimonas sp. LJ205]
MNITSQAAARNFGTLVAALALLGALVGCGAQNPVEERTPMPPAATPTPSPTDVAPPTPAEDVPRVDADISANQPALSIPPIRVRVGDLGIDVPVTPLGLAPDGTMGLDPNPAIAAWYRYGPSPSAKEGATVIAAHVDSLIYDVGPFAALANASVGHQVLVTTSDGLEHRYLVESVQLIDKLAVPWDQIFDRTGPARLILVTCGGEFDYDTRHYLGSVIVTATPVG